MRECTVYYIDFTGEPFASFSGLFRRVQINVILTDKIRILSLPFECQKVKNNCHIILRRAVLNSFHSNRFQWCPLSRPY